MPVPVVPVPWAGSLLWLLAIAAGSFAVSEVAANIFRLSRRPYIAVLTLVTAALTIGYVAWADLNPIQLLTTRWGWGLLAAPLSAAFLIIGMTRLPVAHRYPGGSLVPALLWEALVYGIAEGILLSALPVLVTWQMIHGLGWSGAAGTLALWTLPIVASIAVIIVHHLGYWEYRNRMLAPISLGCGLLSLGYLVTGSPIGPILGHILAHASSLLHGAELPPHPHPATIGQPEAVHAPAGSGPSARS
jgi:hypothetical protein